MIPWLVENREYLLIGIVAVLTLAFLIGLAPVKSKRKSSEESTTKDSGSSEDADSGVAAKAVAATAATAAAASVVASESETAAEAEPEPVAPPPVEEAVADEPVEAAVPAVEVADEAVAEEVPEVVAEPETVAQEPDVVADAAPEPAVEVEPEPEVEVAPAVEAVTEPEPIEPTAEVVAEEAPEPEPVETAPEAVVEDASEPVVVIDPMPEVKAALEIAAVSEPVVCSPEPVQETVAEDIAEVVAPEVPADVIEPEAVAEPESVAEVVSEPEAETADDTATPAAAVTAAGAVAGAAAALTQDEGGTYLADRAKVMLDALKKAPAALQLKVDGGEMSVEPSDARHALENLLSAINSTQDADLTNKVPSVRNCFNEYVEVLNRAVARNINLNELSDSHSDRLITWLETIVATNHVVDMEPELVEAAEIVAEAPESETVPSDSTTAAATAAAVAAAAELDDDASLADRATVLLDALKKVPAELQAKVDAGESSLEPAEARGALEHLLSGIYGMQDTKLANKVPSVRNCFNEYVEVLNRAVSRNINLNELSDSHSSRLVAWLGTIAATNQIAEMEPEPVEAAEAIVEEPSEPVAEVVEAVAEEPVAAAPAAAQNEVPGLTEKANALLTALKKAPAELQAKVDAGDSSVEPAEARDALEDLLSAIYGIQDSDLANKVPSVRNCFNEYVEVLNRAVSRNINLNELSDSHSDRLEAWLGKVIATNQIADMNS